MEKSTLSIKETLSITFRTLKILFHAAPGGIAFLGILSTIAGVCPFLTLILSRAFLDSLARACGQQAFEMEIIWLLFFLFLTNMMLSVVNNLSILLKSDVSGRISLLVNAQVLEKCVHLPMSQYDNETTYNRIRFTSEQTSIRCTNLINTVFSIVQCLISFASVVCVLVSFNGIIVIASVVASIPLFFVNKYVSSFWYKISVGRVEKQRYSDVLRDLMLRNDNIKELKLFGSLSYLKSRILNQQTDFFREDQMNRKKFCKIDTAQKAANDFVILLLMICVDQNGQAVEISVADQMWLDDAYFKEKQLRLGTDAPRAALAYRVSTKGQVDHDDIPMQKIDCRKFAQKQGWRVVKEVAEKGVSGSKVSASKRDAIQQLKEEAANGEFDILLVYMFDRLGRIESETPFVLEWFVQHGIEMWSTHEGQQKIETHGDKLMNYIRFWQAAGESEKTSIRTRDRIRQIVSSGHYTGGFVCYGYQLVDQGRRNKRDKPVMDLVINEEEATWVRELFYKVIQEGTSGYALAEMLNNRGLRTRAGAKFQSSNILRIIRHEGYTGYIITKNARSEYIPELQIIDQETFGKANDIISRRSAKTAQDRRIAHTSQNPTLLAGIVYCAHCGAKMSGFMHTDRYKLADGSIREKVQPKYNCFQRGQRNKGGRDCDGQALYLAERVDAIVLKIVEEVFEQIRDTPYSQVAENRIRQESNLQKTKRAAAEKKIKAAQHALERFEGEILKCLDGTSNFTEDMIAKQIRRYQQELDDAKAEYAELQNARLNEAAEIRKLRTYYDDFKGWAEEFDTAPLEMKRMILSHLIDRVEVGRKYQVIVKFNMKYRQFLECTAETYNTEIGA